MLRISKEVRDCIDKGLSVALLYIIKKYPLPDISIIDIINTVNYKLIKALLNYQSLSKSLVLKIFQDILKNDRYLGGLVYDLIKNQPIRPIINAGFGDEFIKLVGQSGLTYHNIDFKLSMKLQDLDYDFLSKVYEKFPVPVKNLEYIIYTTPTDDELILSGYTPVAGHSGYFYGYVYSDSIKSDRLVIERFVYSSAPFRSKRLVLKVIFSSYGSVIRGDIASRTTPVILGPLCKKSIEDVIVYGKRRGVEETKKYFLV